MTSVLALSPTDTRAMAAHNFTFLEASLVIVTKAGMTAASAPMAARAFTAEHRVFSSES
jgi:hypothetical protein